MSEEKELCSCCNENEARNFHTCPFAEEINDDDSLCNCCADCQDNCAMDI